MKKIICLLLSFVIILCSVSFYASATNQLVKLDVVFSDKLDYSINNSDLSCTQQKYFYKGSEFSRVYSSYSTLNDLQKEIYNNVINAGIGKLTIPMSFDKGEFPVEYWNETFFYEIMEAIAIDNPQLFYFAGYSISNAYTYSGSSYIAKFDYVVHMYSNVTYTESDLQSRYEDMISVVKNTAVNTTNRYNFIRSVHDFLCNTAYYPDLDSPEYIGNCHDAYGCLVDGVTVCQGYSDAFKLFCDEYKIPCVCLTGTANGGNHMWNAVQMDDGKWYLIDITWDDQDEYGIYNDFFLVGLNTKDRFFTGYPFSESHLSDGNLYLPNLDYAIDKYTENDHNTAFKATYNSIVKEGNYLVRSYFDTDDALVYYDGMYVEAENLTTNQTFTAPSGNNGADENWTMVLVGDCNGDDACNALDLSEVVNKVLSDAEVVSPGDMAADADCDGVLDVIDISIIERAVSGSNTNIVIE